MQLKNISIFAAMLAALPGFAAAGPFDHASLEFASHTKVRMARMALQANWDKRWFESNGTHVGGYWDLSLAQWRGSAYMSIPGQSQNITDIGVTPVFRFQTNDLKGWYAEGGIGAHLLSALYDNDFSRLSTAFQFGDHIGAGYVFNNGWEAGINLQHFSNGGIKKPNNGVNFVAIKLARAF